MSHTTETAIAAVDMLLIKPSLWARVGAGTRARWTDPGHDTPRGQAIQESQRAPGDRR